MDFNNGGITYSIVFQASRHFESGFQQRYSGINANDWRMPIIRYGLNFFGWKERLLSSNYTGNFEISQQNWNSSARRVDAVMHLFLNGLRYFAWEYNGLVVERYITQGSARDGLKVIAADEFDSMVLFKIPELWKYLAADRDTEDPSFCRMKVVGLTGSQIQHRFPRLCKEGVFILSKSGDIYFSSKAMHEQVFESMIDKTIARINNLKKAWINEVKLSRKMNPPAINIEILNRGIRPSHGTQRIAIDFVPAICIDTESVKFRGSLREFPIYAVCKWQGKPETDCHTWSVKSNSYENALIDAARKDERGLLVLNALMLVKTFFQNAKTMNLPLQLVYVLKTYHLKQIMLYLLGFLCYKHTHITIDGTEAALIYFVRVMDMVLMNKSLPHLFFSDVGILQNVIPGCNLHCGRDVNLLENVSTESASQAMKDLELKLMPALGIRWVDKRDLDQGSFCNDFVTNVLKQRPQIANSYIIKSAEALQQQQQQQRQEKQQLNQQQHFLTRIHQIGNMRTMRGFAEQRPQSDLVVKHFNESLNRFDLRVGTARPPRYHPYILPEGVRKFAGATPTYF
ncbi:hypothetical protein MAR_025479 [Mya arenaria]|uniref:Mab-21-like nucleotidyltransferase domain-containing protein n=1 Tax=Mya arenaria TaxID=6604 RepID=A0ABY7ESC2_MYAAR|nr:uncharacterized protein LOC128245150 [Mya arenaria]WAR11299.1 hypothetical protein MAR_025479 [Mya arenaria]